MMAADEAPVLDGPVDMGCLPSQLADFLRPLLKQHALQTAVTSGFACAQKQPRFYRHWDYSTCVHVHEAEKTCYLISAA